MDAAESGEDQQDPFLKELNAFMLQRGTPVSQPPVLGGRVFDLGALYKHVTERGGLENVLKEKSWNAIVQLVDLPNDCANPAYTLRVLYLKYLYAYERKNFLHIEEDESATNYTPKVRASSGPAHGMRLAAPLARPVLRLDYRRTPLPADSMRLRNKVKDILQLQKICFSLRSGTTATVQWGLEVLALKSCQGEIILRNSVVGNSEEVASLGIGSALLSALSDLAKSYYTETPTILWKSEKVSDLPNETQILAILRNLTLVPQNNVEMASHTKCVEFLILSLSHPNPTCVEDALAALAALSDHLVLSWEEKEAEENGRENKSANTPSISLETSKVLVNKVSDLLREGLSTSLAILANLTGQVSNWPHLETIVFTNVPHFIDCLDSMLNSGEESSNNALKIIFNISRHGTKTKQQMASAKGIMHFLVRIIGQPRNEEEVDDMHQLVHDTLSNLCVDNSTKQQVLLHEPSLLHFVLLESPAVDSVTDILSTLANP